MCLTAVCRAQYIGSNYLNMKVDYVVDESQVQGTLGYGKVFKTFRVGANLNYRNLNREQVQANTVTVGPEFAYWLLKGRKFSLLGVASGTIGYQRAKTKSELIYLERSRAFVYGYEVGIRPEVLLSHKVALLPNIGLRCCLIQSFATITTSVWVAWFIYKLKYLCL